MANPLQFKPPSVDPRTELNRRLAAAPTEHAEALLVVWDTLQAAHDQGLLDTVHGLVTAKDTIFATLAQFAKMPEGCAAIRNFIAFTEIFATIDPDMLDRLSKSMASAARQHQQEEKKPPSLWQIARRANSEDSRRGLSLLTLLLSSFGRALKE